MSESVFSNVTGQVYQSFYLALPQAMGARMSALNAAIMVLLVDAGMVFQQFNLFPQMTALENVAFGPRKVRGLSRAEARDLAAELLRKVGL